MFVDFAEDPDFRNLATRLEIQEDIRDLQSYFRGFIEGAIRSGDPLFLTHLNDLREQVVLDDLAFKQKNMQLRL